MKPIIILSGPTASGKSDLALNVAAKINAGIINCDSKQLYREIPIISAQPSKAEREKIPHELYGVISAAENCSVGRWLDMAQKAIDKTHAEGRIPLLVGGTGMYIKSLVHGISQIPDIDDGIRREARDFLQENGVKALYGRLAEIDPDMAATLKENDSQRIARACEVIRQTGKSLLWWQQQEPQMLYDKDQFLHFFLSPEREKVYMNCNRRFEKMVEAGVIDEIKELEKMQLSDELPAMRAHGVPELLAYLSGIMSLEDAIDQAQKNTRHYIKRQFTWFRGQMPEAVALEGEGAEERMVETISKRSKN